MEYTLFHSDRLKWVTDWFIGLCEWGFSSWFHRDCQLPPATSCNGFSRAGGCLALDFFGWGLIYATVGSGFWGLPVNTEHFFSIPPFQHHNICMPPLHGSLLLTTHKWLLISGVVNVYFINTTALNWIHNLFNYCSIKYWIERLSLSALVL